MAKLKTYNPRYASLSIRIGLAIVFAYAAISGIVQPEAWVGFVPAFTADIVDPMVSLAIISVVQLVLAAWLLTGRYIKIAASIAIAFLAGVLVFDFDTILITFRDFGLIGAAVALIFLNE